MTHCCKRPITTSSSPTVYRPRPSEKNKLTAQLFFHEFSTLLEVVAVASGHLIITGDFNFHMDDINNKETTKFVDLLDSVGLQQRVVGATHSRGHTLDLIIDRQEESLLLGPVEIVRELPSDLSAVIYFMDLPRPCLTKKTIRHRALRRMDMQLLRDDILNSQKVMTSTI